MLKYRVLDEISYPAVSSSTKLLQRAIMFKPNEIWQRVHHLFVFWYVLIMQWVADAYRHQHIFTLHDNASNN